MKRLLLAFVCALAAVAHGQQPAPAPAPSPAANPDAGFVPIFDGKTLTGWDGDPLYWRVEDGNLVGEITAATVIKRNTFIIWRGGTPGDFELKLEYRISAEGNSGVNYRSIALDDAKWSLAGYQADIDGARRNKSGVRYTGQNYEERGRTFLARRGQVARVAEDGKPIVIGTIGEEPELARFIHEEDWNELHIIARGNTLIHLLNGHVMSIVVDDDAAHRRADGLIGVQVHVGPPMKVAYRNIRLKSLPPAASHVVP